MELSIQQNHKIDYRLGCRSKISIRSFFRIGIRSIQNDFIAIFYLNGFNLWTIRFYQKLKIINSDDAADKKKCLEKCDGQKWDDGFNDMSEPCSSLMHSLSIAIIFIISLIR